MKEIKKFLNVDKFYIDDTCIIKRDKEIYFLDENFNLIEIANNVYAFQVHNNQVYYQFDNLTSIYRYDLDNRQTLILEGCYVLSITFGNNLCYIMGNENNIKSIFIINIHNFQCQKTMKYETGIDVCELNDFELLFRKRDFTNSKSYLCRDNLLWEKNIWQYKIINSNKVHGDILKYGNTLIIPLDNNHLLGINAETGEKLWELEDCLNYYKLDNQTGLLYGYGAERYEIIDAVKGEKILRKQFEGSMDKYKIFASQHMSTLSGDGIYFTSNQQQIKFGKINIRTHEIEFVQELVEDTERIGRANASKPVCHNERLYILDSAGTLHIFEEE
jgi:hypothetical protein